jgi:hypothetical protein
MSHLTRIALASLLLAAALPASAAPRARTPPDKAATDRWVAACVHERTGPTGGIPAREALELCRSIAKHQARIDRLAARAAAAIEACEAEVSVACEDTTERSSDHGECSDATLRASHAFDVCAGRGPAWRGER